MPKSVSKPVIEVRSLTKEFQIGRQTIHSLRGVDLKINPGEYVIIFGPSGCGKSTLLNLIAGLEPPTAGQVFIRGKDLAHASSRELTLHRREKVGMVFQQFNLLKTMSILNNVLLPGLFRNQPLRSSRKRATQLLTDVGLGRFLRHRPSELSGGQQQRVAIARALFNNPWILLADEPTGNVDSKTANDIMKLFYHLNRQSRRTILLVTHNPEYLHFADRVLYMKDGMIAVQKRQKRTKKEKASIQTKRRASKLSRELSRSKIEEHARRLGINPNAFAREQELANAILTHAHSDPGEDRPPIKASRRRFSKKSKDKT